MCRKFGQPNMQSAVVISSGTVGDVVILSGFVRPAQMDIQVISTRVNTGKGVRSGEVRVASNSIKGPRPGEVPFGTGQQDP